MTRRSLLLLTCVPLAAAQDSVLEAARSAALNYSRSLPDFVCTESVRRFADWKGDGKWVSQDNLTIQVTFFRQVETYKLAARNGRPTTQKYESLAGAFTKGEFGSALRWIFQPSSAAVFESKGYTIVGNQRASLYGYRIDAAHSVYELQAGVKSIHPGFHGEVAIDEETSRVLRIVTDIEVEGNFPVMRTSSTIEYGTVTIDAQKYLLPVHAEIFAQERPKTIEKRGYDAGSSPPVFTQVIPGLKYRNLVEFKSYRKYTSKSRITFN